VLLAVFLILGSFAEAFSDFEDGYLFWSQDSHSSASLLEAEIQATESLSLPSNRRYDFLDFFAISSGLNFSRFQARTNKGFLFVSTFSPRLLRQSLLDLPPPTPLLV